MWTVAKRFIRSLLRTLWKRAGIIVTGTLAAVILGLGARAYFTLEPGSDFGQKATIVDLTITALGILSIVLLIIQLRQTAVYNRTLCYHQFFADTPSTEKVRAMRQCLERLGLPIPTVFAPLTREHAVILRADKGHSGGPEPQQPADQVVRNYLNDFEGMCAAINVGLLSDKYVREIEGTRTINAYYGFEQVIRLIAAEHEEQARQADARSPALRQIHNKAYVELRKVAQRWRVRREVEHRQRARHDETFRRWRARAERWFTHPGGEDGVSPE